MKVEAHNSLQSVPDGFDELKFIMTFLTILGVTEICSFRLDLEGNLSKRYLSHQD